MYTVSKAEYALFVSVVWIRGTVIMADVAATIKVMPESPEVDLAELEEALATALPDGASFRAVEQENVAFGLVALRASVLVEDAEGGTDAVESAFEGVAGVESVTVENVGRL